MSDKKIYTALGPNVFVKEKETELKKGDWVIPDSLDLDFTFGEVISCSEGYFEHGSFVPANVQIGDNVAFMKASGTKVNFNGMKLIRVYMGDIVAKEVNGEIFEEDREDKKGSK